MLAFLGYKYSYQTICNVVVEKIINCLKTCNEAVEKLAKKDVNSSMLNLFNKLKKIELGSI